MECTKRLIAVARQPRDHASKLVCRPQCTAADSLAVRSTKVRRKDCGSDGPPLCSYCNRLQSHKCASLVQLLQPAADPAEYNLDVYVVLWLEQAGQVWLAMTAGSGLRCASRSLRCAARGACSATQLIYLEPAFAAANRSTLFSTTFFNFCKSQDCGECGSSTSMAATTADGACPCR